jgi:hypothetical protein
MNRRTFIQTATVGVGGLAGLSLTNAFADMKPSWPIGCSIARGRSGATTNRSMAGKRFCSGGEAVAEGEDKTKEAEINLVSGQSVHFSQLQVSGGFTALRT